MKEFNLDEYLKNPKRKVVTRDGREVTRILCTDAKSKNYPIVALIKSPDEEEEYPLRYTVNGQYFPDYKQQYDLFFVTEKHEGWGVISGSSLFSSIFSSKKEAEEYIERAGTKNTATIAKIEWED